MGVLKINKTGIKILNIKAATLYGYNLGIRNRYDYTDGVLSNSLFSMYMLKNGMSVWKDESTRDFICLDFDFGLRSYEEEKEHLGKLSKKAETDEEKKRLSELTIAVDDKKGLYRKCSKDELREIFYKNGISVHYNTHDKDGNIINSQEIKYKMLYRNSSKAKLGQVVFVNEMLYDKAYDWLTMGLGSLMPRKKAKIVEMSAYAPLTTSTIVGTLKIPTENILILKDQVSTLSTVANIVKAEDYDGFKRVLDEEKTNKAKEKAIANNKYDSLGEPIYKKVYKKVPTKKKKCVVTTKETVVKNTLWDGMAIIDESIIPEDINGMVLLRQHFFKACAFRGRIQQFFKDWCSKNNYNYDTYEIQDMFGITHKLKDITLITTDNAIKWKKFSSLMGNTEREAYEYWCNKVRADDSCFGIVKTDHESKLGSVQQMSYQMINTLPCSSENVKEIAQTSIDYVELLKANNDEFNKFLKKNSNEVNHYEMMSALYEYNSDFANSQWFRYEKRQILRNYVNKLRSGKITVNGDNLTACGNPYALLLYSVGDDWTKDPTLQPEKGVIQCYTPRFEHGEYLCAFRNPHNSPNNICYLRNCYSEEMSKYFPFSKNILALNCIQTDIQDRANGMDWDSDFMFVTNNPTMVQCAQDAYTNYHTIVNALEESGIEYENSMEAYAEMDNKFAKSRMGIGYSSNLAQLALTYYWTEKVKVNSNKQTIKELHDNFIILSVLAQIIIDGCKREYEIDGLEEIERIQKMDCMYKTKKIKDEHGEIKEIKCDFPIFMKYTRDIPVTKNGIELPYDIVKNSRDKLKRRINYSLICPMNWLQEWLNKIQGASQEKTTPTEEYLIEVEGKANYRQVSKIQSLVANYDDFLKTNRERFKDEDFMIQFHQTTDEFLRNMKKVKIGNIVTMNKLIRMALGVHNLQDIDSNVYKNATKHTRRMFNSLYKVYPQKFLANFKIQNISENAEC